MIKVRVTATIERLYNRRIYNAGEELIVHEINTAASWKDQYMYRYKRQGEVYIDRIDKNCVKIVDKGE